MPQFDWAQLLTADRLRLNEAGEPICYAQPEISPRTPAEADIQRITFSAPFRRLAGKTQVHPLAKVDYVHNRLTHTLEVAETGAALAQRLTARLGLTPAQITAASLHVKAACLGHDIGNPPYGHAGEAAIQAWVERNLDTLGNFLTDGVHTPSTPAPEVLLMDLRKFDGNAQAFRLLSHPSPTEGAYFRLTCASLGALVKYPYCATETPSAKYSCFQTARPCFETVMTALGLKHKKGFSRHPLSYLTEIADDICYCVTDCEDAVLMGLLDEGLVREWYLNLLEDSTATDIKPGATLSFLRARVIGDLMRCFTDDLEHAFQTPSSLAAFAQNSPTWLRLQTLKQRYRIVFDDAAKARTELKAQDHFHRVLDAYFAVTRTIRQKNPTDTICRLRKYTFGENFIATHANRPSVWWLHAIIDHITGMTDAALHRFSEGLSQIPSCI